MSRMGKLQGGMYVAATLVQNLFSESDAGLVVGWGDTDVENVLQLLAVHQRYVFIAHGPRVVARNKVSNIIAHVAQVLQNPSAGVDGSGSVILVGHDTSFASVVKLLNTQPGQLGSTIVALSQVAGCVSTLSHTAIVRPRQCASAIVLSCKYIFSIVYHSHPRPL